MLLFFLISFILQFFGEMTIYQIGTRLRERKILSISVPFIILIFMRLCTKCIEIFSRNILLCTHIKLEARNEIYSFDCIRYSLYLNFSNHLETKFISTHTECSRKIVNNIIKSLLK